MRAWLAGGLAVALVLAVPATAQVDDLGGFGTDEDFDVEVEEAAVVDRWWEIDGNVGFSSSINFIDHESATGTDYLGLQRLRLRLNLELDFELPREFDLRISPYVWYDFAYILNGIGNYSRDVVRQYEWEGDFQDSYLEGPLLEDLDVKIGRQVVNWGRSDSLRVLDVLNPLDNREPGRADIEDLRLSLGMAKLDYYVGDWTATFIAIPEIRYDELPPVGSDFNPLNEAAGALLKRTKPKSFENWEFAGGLTGIFEGWDISFHYAYVYEDFPRVRVTGSPFALPQLLIPDRLHMGGLGGNYTVGSWLFKGEAAAFHGFRYTRNVAPPGSPVPVLETPEKENTRVDVLLGVEYYGFADHTLALEVVNRHQVDYDGLVLGLPTFLRENSTIYALRWTADWLNARLQTTVLALLFGYEVQDGSVLRFQGAYTIRDGLVLTAGALLFTEGDLPPLDTWADNDRFFVDLKWSF